MKIYLLEREDIYTPLIYTDKVAAVNAMIKFANETGRVAIIRFYESQEDPSQPLKQVHCLSSDDSEDIGVVSFE